MSENDFEKALSRLSAIVSSLEKGDLPLEESLQLFEEGVKLSRYCSDRLEEAERRIEVLVKGKGGKTTEEPFEEVNLEDQSGREVAKTLIEFHPLLIVEQVPGRASLLRWLANLGMMFCTFRANSSGSSPDPFSQGDCAGSPGTSPGEQALRYGHSRSLFLGPGPGVASFFTLMNQLASSPGK